MQTNECSLREKSIVFIGFMGVGKTTIGKLVAKKLYRSFIDIDEAIEQEYQMPVPEIFKTIGEKEFREKEKQLIQHYASQKLKIISVGGGAFMQKEVREACMADCIVIYLDITWDVWKNERLHMLMESRPVLQGRSMEEIEDLFNKRKMIYAEHSSKVSTDHLTEEEIAEYITDSLKVSWKMNE
ncbi:shikimate kinase [Sinobaca sp. H24]|uniref:shikimate kinase n=1 Tax=Sinobaca sp. H24 TaxID=2923376 RepID=UPI00207A17C4|nr:shikimate kinase [Sinobaca sp. H24]